jgi:hypothetical protein
MTETVEFKTCSVLLDFVQDIVVCVVEIASLTKKLQEMNALRGLFSLFFFIVF